MQFFVFGKPQEAFINNPSSPEVRELVASEFAKSREYYSKGYLRHIWVLGDNKGALCLFEADSLEHVTELVAGYPMQREGYVHHEIYLMEPYPGFLLSNA
jgi:muconolactone delta-isomerase